MVSGGILPGHNSCPRGFTYFISAYTEAILKVPCTSNAAVQQLDLANAYQATELSALIYPDDVFFAKPKLSLDLGVLYVIDCLQVSSARVSSM